MTDHDQRLKAIIREFFADFLRLFFADWAARFDLTRVEWLDKELLPDPPDGSRHLLDLVARLHVTEPVGEQHPDVPDTWLALVHIEIESPDRTTALKPRLPAYYIHLRDRYGLPVLPIVLYLKVGLDGIGVDIVEETFWEMSVLTLRYLYVGLPGLDAVQYIAGQNPLGVALAALMRIPKDRVIELGREAFRLLTEAPLTEHQRFLLLECVEAYLPVDPQDRDEFEAIRRGTDNPEVGAMNQTTFERGIETGRREMLVDGVEETLRLKFGLVSASLGDRLRSLSLADLLNLRRTVVTATTLDELNLPS